MQLTLGFWNAFLLLDAFPLRQIRCADSANFEYVPNTVMDGGFPFHRISNKDYARLISELGSLARHIASILYV